MKYFFTITLLVFTCKCVYSQTANKPFQTWKQAVRSKARLSAEQTARVMAIEDSCRAALKALTLNTRFSAADKRLKAEALIAQKNSKYSEFLSKEQLYTIIAPSERLKIDSAYARQYRASQKILKNKQPKAQNKNWLSASSEKESNLHSRKTQISYAMQIHKINTDPQLSPAAKRFKIGELTRVKSEHLKKTLSDRDLREKIKPAVPVIKKHSEQD